jgi:hypothetical protein
LGHFGAPRAPARVESLVARARVIPRLHLFRRAARL